MVNGVEIGATLTEDFLNYSLSEFQKVIQLIFGEDEASAESGLNPNAVFMIGTSRISLDVTGGTNYYNFGFNIFPSMPSGYNIITGFNSWGVHYDDTGHTFPPSIICNSETDITTRSSGGSYYFRVSRGSINYQTPNFLFENLSGSASDMNYSINPLSIPSWTTGHRFGLIVTDDPAFPVVSYGASPSNFSGSSVLRYTPVSSGGNYTFNEIRDTLVDLPQFPNYVPPTWDDLLKGEIYIPDFYPAQLPNLEFDTEIPFDVELPQNVGEATTSILASSFDFLSGTGLLTFLCVICLLRIFIFKFKKE